MRHWRRGHRQYANVQSLCPTGSTDHLFSPWIFALVFMDRKPVLNSAGLSATCCSSSCRTSSWRVNFIHSQIVSSSQALPYASKHNFCFFVCIFISVVFQLCFILLHIVFPIVAVKAGVPRDQDTGQTFCRWRSCGGARCRSTDQAWALRRI